MQLHVHNARVRQAGPPRALGSDALRTRTGPVCAGLRMGQGLACRPRALGPSKPVKQAPPCSLTKWVISPFCRHEEAKGGQA